MSVVTKLGATKKQIDEQMGVDYTNVRVFKEFGKYHHRIIQGPIRDEHAFYPTWRKDAETGVLEESFNKIELPKRDKKNKTVIDKIAALDNKIQADNGVDSKKIRSQFKRQLKYIWIVLSRDEQENGLPWIGAWTYPVNISKKLHEFMSMTRNAGDSKLMYGPIWSYDVIIEKYKTNDMYGVGYSVNVDPSSLKYAGKIPKKLYEDAEYAAKNEDKIEAVFNNVFTEEERALIEKYTEEHDIDSYTSPVKNDEEIMQVFQEFPIRWDAEKDGVPVFKYKTDLLESLKVYADNKLQAIAETKQLSAGDDADENNDTAFNSKEDDLVDDQKIKDFSNDENEDEEEPKIKKEVKTVPKVVSKPDPAGDFEVDDYEDNDLEW